MILLNMDVVSKVISLGICIVIFSCSSGSPTIKEIISLKYIIFNFFLKNIKYLNLYKLTPN
jgi:hypothetical protein